MKRTLLGVLALAALSFAVAGCDTRSSGTTGAGSGRVAVIDFERVLGEMGWREAIQESMRTVVQSLQAEANQAKAQLDATIEAERKKQNLPEKLDDCKTDEQKKQFVTLAQAYQRQLMAYQQNFNQRQQAAYRDQVIQYRDEMKPKAKEVSKELGLSVILTTESNLLHFDESVDITGRVIEKLQKDPAVKGKVIKQYVPVQVPVNTPILPPPASQPATPPAK